MAEKRRFLDVWILDSNTVYREVPFTVVTDWLQQGRLLAEDKARPSGTNQWLALGETPAFAAYIPKAEPYRVEDQAEALEPVQVDFAWKRPHGAEDDDVDMIPLIDVSLVLLVFFMMTAAVGGAAALFNTPAAESKLLHGDPELIWVGVRDDGGQPVYSRGKGEGPEEAKFGGDRGALLKDIQELLNGQSQPVDINIKAEKSLPYGTVRDLTVDIEQFRRQGKVRRVFGGVSEKRE